MEGRPLRIGIVGFGLLGAYHADCYRRLPGCDVVAVADSSAAARERAVQAGLQAFASPEELFRALGTSGENGIDLVDVCTPTPWHASTIQAALAAGVRHIICEKPLARTAAEARGVVEAARAAQANVYVGHVVRFFPEFVAAREAILRGDIGEPAIARTSRRTIFPTAAWYGDPAQSGGVILDMLVHDFDWLRWCFGEVQRVYARSVAAGAGGRSQPARLDYALVTLRFENGVIAHVEGSWAHRRFGTSIEIGGSAGLITFDSLSTSAFRAERRDGQNWSPPRSLVTGDVPGGESPHFREIAHFVECATRGTPPRVTVEDGWRAVEIATAAERSVQTGRVVTIAEVREG